ncbi:hypothetical protein BIWAKO_05948 [Bosea sp. BIWAKO-01]|nr:hypothetical protein BIWAKO_05948 [Bosea sp. BIWAKO-01]
MVGDVAVMAHEAARHRLGRLALAPIDHPGQEHLAKGTAGASRAAGL